MTDSIDGQGYRANVGIVLMRDDGQVFLGGRAGSRGWQFPQGGVQDGEGIEAALYRELEEEVGLSPRDVELLASTRDWLRYRLPPQYLRRGSSPPCVGQKQRWFLLKLKADAGAVRFDRTREPPEFDRARWVDYWDPVREVIYFKRQVYRRALHELGRVAFPEGLPPYPSWWKQRSGIRTGERPPTGRSPPEKGPVPR